MNVNAQVKFGQLLAALRVKLHRLAEEIENAKGQKRDGGR